MKLAVRTALAVAFGAALASTLSLAAPASAAPSSTNGCRILHDLYQDASGVHAYVEDTCEQRALTLDVYRNGVLFAAISGGFAVNWDHTCTCADVTTWSDNWGDQKTVPCA
jgi:hypothetical protein